MDHNARDGSAKFIKECTLPLTGVRVVDMIISDVGVFMINDDGATLIELALDVSIEDARSRTEAEFDVAQHLK
jgi:3-oxoacid CoA-transferase subunit B